MVAIDLELNLGGAIVQFVAQVVTIFLLVNIGVTPHQLNTILIIIVPIQILASGNGDDAGVHVIGTLYPGVVVVMPPHRVLDISIATATDDNIDLAVQLGHTNTEETAVDAVAVALEP